MNMITKFTDVFADLKEKGICKRMVAAWAVDEHTIEACSKATDLGFVKVALVGDENMIKVTCNKKGIDAGKFEIVNEPVELKAVAKAVQMVHDGEGDVLMKGLCSTDKFLRAILNKETGLLPPKGLLSHVGVIESPMYHKLIFLTDMAVIPLPEFRQKMKMAGFVVSVAQSFGIAKPKIAFIAASEQVLDSMQACMEAAALAKMCDRGQIRGCIGDGPLALDVALDKESVEIKKLTSPVAGDADCLLFPNIESANVFWKTNSKLSQGVKQAGMLVGTTVPCVLASRADSVDTKLNSIAEAVMFVK
jgi:phosphotransacetylase